MVESLWSLISFPIATHTEAHDGAGGRVGVGRWIALLPFDPCKHLSHYKNR